MAVINIFLSLKNSFWGIKERHQLLMRVLFFIFFVYTTSEFICNYNLIQCSYYSCKIIIRATTTHFYRREETLSDDTVFYDHYFRTAGHSVLCPSVTQDRQQGPLTRFTVCFPESKRALCNKLLHTLFLTRQQSALFLAWARNGETSQTARVSPPSKHHVMILTSPCS